MRSWWSSHAHTLDCPDCVKLAAGTKVVTTKEDPMDIKGCPRPGRHISHTWLDDGWRCICIGDGVPMRNGLPPALSPGADVLARRLLDVLDEHSQAEIDPAVAAAAQELGRAIRWQGMDWAEVLPAPAQAWQHAAATDIAPSGQLPVAVCGRGPTDIGASYVVVPKEGHVTCPDCRQALRRDERPRDEQPFAIDVLGADHPEQVPVGDVPAHPRFPLPEVLGIMGGGWHYIPDGNAGRAVCEVEPRPEGWAIFSTKDPAKVQCPACKEAIAEVWHYAPDPEAAEAYCGKVRHLGHVKLVSCTPHSWRVTCGACRAMAQRWLASETVEEHTSQEAYTVERPRGQQPVKSVNLMEFRAHPQDPCPGPPVCIEDLEHWHTSTASHVKIVIPGNPPSYQRSQLPRTVVECPGPFGHNFEGIPTYPPCKEKAAHWHALDDAGALWTIPGEVPDGLHP